MLISGISTLIITCETNAIRFERFCLAIADLAEGVTFVPTSANYDQGRDGRSLQPAKGSHGHLLCVTLDREIDDKVQRDLDKLRLSSKPDRLLYCCSQKLTEHHIDKLTAAIRRRLHSASSVAVLGADQLGHLAETYEGVFRAYYKPEYETVVANLISPEQGDGQIEKRGLRLALVAMGSEDAHTLRRILSHRIVLDLLSHASEPITAGSLAVKLAADLRLPKSPAATYVHSILKELSAEALVREEGDKWRLTQPGQEALV